MYPTENAFANPGAASVSIARQAIVDKNQAVVGYELFNRSVQKGEHTASSDAQMLFNLLSMAESETLVGKALLFVNCTLDSLAAGHVDLIAPEHYVLQIPAVPLSQIDQIQLRLPTLRALHARGFRISVESNGTVAAPEGIDWLCISPKAGAPWVQRSGQELKLVWPQPGFDLQALEQDTQFTHRFLQPMDGLLQRQNTAACIDACLAHPAWRLSLQTHKLTGIR